MCGFVVEIIKNPQSVVKEVNMDDIHKMTYEIEHRGPDSIKFWSDGWIGGGFCRLAIQDISERNDQPLLSNDGRYIIFYNGEIYNRDALKAELQAYQLQWKTSGDTEVVLNGYIAFGSDLLSKISGMFTFIIIDTKQKTAFIARDQLGVKPLYYTENKHSIFFASEIKAFRHIMHFAVNDKTIYEQIKFRYVAGKNTIYKKIYRLNAGEQCWVGQNKIEFKKYYNLSDTFQTKEQIDEDKIKYILKRSIDEHTLSDVGYTVQLSGGIDSSYISAVLAEDFKHKIQTISGGVKDTDLDERQYQEIVSNQFSANHTRVEFTDRDLADNLSKFTYYMDMPIIHVSCVFLYLLAQEAAKHSKVIITGEGADEVFGGYNWLDLSKQYKISKAIQQYGMTSSFIPPLHHKLKTLKTYMNTSLYEIGQACLSNETLDHLMPDVPKDLDYRYGLSKELSSLDDNNFYLGQECYLQSMLERQDRASMAASVEARVPFCNIELYNYMNSIPVEEKIKKHRTKHVLKNLSSQYFSSQFIDRKKNGFALPLDDWLKNKKSPLGEYLDLITDRTFYERGIFDPKYVNNLIKDHMDGKKKHGKLLMNLILFEVWHRLTIN